MDYNLKRPRINRLPDNEILDELRVVASRFGNRIFTRHEFDRVATRCNGSVVLSRFGPWKAALNAAGLVLSPQKKDRSQISNLQLFEELERIWRQVGHRPSQDEWEACNPKYSYTTFTICSIKQKN